MLLFAILKLKLLLNRFGMHKHIIIDLNSSPGVTIDEIKAKTAGNLVISDQVKTMSFD